MYEYKQALKGVEMERLDTISSGAQTQFSAHARGTCGSHVVQVMEVEGHRYMALILVLEDDYGYEYKVMLCE